MNATEAPTFDALLARDTQVREPTDAENLRHLRHRLLIPVAAAVALLLTWMSFAPLSGAVVAPAQIKVDLKERIAQTRNQYRQQAADELKQSTAKLRELEERLQEMRVSGAGEVMAPRDPLLDVVPSPARLVIEARIRPEDINHVQKHASAQVRLTSFDARTTPLLSGNVTFVSADRITSSDGRESYFTAIVEVDAANLKGHPEIHLQPGMPAELYVATGTRSLFQYLLRPVTSFALRAMREP